MKILCNGYTFIQILEAFWSLAAETKDQWRNFERSFVPLTQGSAKLSRKKVRLVKNLQVKFCFEFEDTFWSVQGRFEFNPFLWNSKNNVVLFRYGQICKFQLLGCSFWKTKKYVSCLLVKIIWSEWKKYFFSSCLERFPTLEIKFSFSIL